MRWLALAGLLLTGTQAFATPRGVVTAVELRSDVAIERPADLLRWVAVEPGSPASEEEVAVSVRNLHASGLAERVEAYRTPHAGGEKLVFVLRGKTLVESVEIVGSPTLKLWRVRPVLAIGEGDALLADRVFRSVYQLQDLYAAEGFLAASIRVEVDVDDERRRAVVRFRIESGEPATVVGVEFGGEIEPLEEEVLREALRSQAGGRYFARKVRDDRERLESWLLGRGYRQAVVDGPEERFVDRSEVHLRYTVELGPRFAVEVAPSAELHRVQRRLLPLAGSERYDETTAERARQRLVTDFQQRGYHEVEVAVREQARGEERLLTVEVDRGARHVLRSVSWTGNETLSDGRLQAVMRTSQRTALSAGSGRLVDVWLEEDLAAIRALYALEGFAKAVVGPPRVAREGDSELTLEIPIVEGPRRTVGSVWLEGATSFEVDELLGELPLRPGGPYHWRREEEALASIRGRYEAAGFNLAQVASTSEVSADGSVDVRFEVLEGPRSVVERVVVRGNQRTEQEFIRRVLSVDPGEPLSQERLRGLQRRLYGLGIFSQVDVGVVPGTPYRSGRDVIVEVREGARQRLTYGLGYDSEDGVRGLLGYSHSNLWGRAVSGRVDLRVSERDRQLRALLRQPMVSRFRLPLTYSVFSIDEEQETFRSVRNGAQVDLQRIRETSRWGLLYTYKTIEIEEADPGLEPLLIDREFSEVAITSLTPSLYLDHRDDALDPTRGWSATMLTELAFESLDADEEFAKLFLQHARYVPLGPGVLAGNLRFGAIEPRAGAGGVDPVCLDNGLTSPTCDVKISERFFAGGRTTHRAYRRDRLGVLGETLLEVAGQGDPVPFGGTGLLLANVDYRFPIAGGLGGTLFVDGGNVWADWRDVTFEDAKWGAGVGLRYASPVGPVRLDVGWKLDRLPDEDPYVVLFSFGNAF